MARAPGSSGHEHPDPHQAMGGTKAWRRLAVSFYARVARDPRLRPLFPGNTLHCAIEELTAFLVQLFGGPSGDSQRRWWLSLRESHQRFRIGQEERGAWMENMLEALDEAQMEGPLRSALCEFFARASSYVVNSGEAGSSMPEGQMGTPIDGIRREMNRRWESQCLLDEAVAALRAGEAERAITVTRSSALRTRFETDRSALTGLLGMMLGSRDTSLTTYVQETIADDPALVHERYAGRTLLHYASAQGNLPMVELLLRLGANPNAQDGGNHTPLYSLANEYSGSNGGEIVRALAHARANVNANEGVKRCTPLHMAARRGHVDIAEALLDCGAEIDARDSLGDTPLRRSVNCNRIQVASLLLARGSNVKSIGSRNLTPLQAARTSSMKQLLETRSTPEHLC